MPTHLTNWQVTTHPNAHVGGPKFHGPCLKGVDEKGRTIVTAAILVVAGRTVTTKAGSTYRIDGDPAPEFAKVLEEKKVRVLKSAPLRNYQLFMEL